MGDFIDYLLIFLPIFFAVAYFTHELQGNKNAIKGHGSDIEALEVKVDDLQSRIDELEERLKTSKK